MSMMGPDASLFPSEKATGKVRRASSRECRGSIGESDGSQSLAARLSTSFKHSLSCCGLITLEESVAVLAVAGLWLIGSFHKG